MRSASLSMASASGIADQPGVDRHVGSQSGTALPMSLDAPSGQDSSMLIIAGYLIVHHTKRDSYVAECVSVVEAARVADGCLDFSITADSADPARIRVFERWESERQLLAFRGSGPSDGQQAAIRDADVKRYDVSSVGEP